MTVHFEPIGAHQILLIEYRIVGAQEPKILELKEDWKKGMSICKFILDRTTADDPVKRKGQLHIVLRPGPPLNNAKGIRLIIKKRQQKHKENHVLHLSHCDMY